MNKIKKRNIITYTIIIVFITIAIILISYRKVIFQKGNPIPYLKAISQLNTNQTYVHVQDNNSNIFITKRDNYDEFHKYIEDNYDVSFKEQMGNGYIFSSNEKEVLVSSELYLKFYIVWTLNDK